MLNPKIAQLVAEIEKLPFDLQETLADDIAADFLDMKFASKLASGESMPAFDALVAQAHKEIDNGKYISLDEWLQEG